ncbi:FecR family protein [Chitinophaga polysaccharea]|uniref:FecR family protein n=1 Tax=Chitinophaga polysaccharea TaxID=1293035 RepID=A0A561PUF2_9BACT|nr:FecR family protein [Chitinophaga polysaccharea]TWF41744.1 FecR family protein [Chitinophaga polysaccharea]
MKEERIDEALRIAALIQQLRAGRITEEELQVLKAWIAADKANEATFRQLSDPVYWKDELQAISKYDINALTQRIFTSANLPLPAPYAGADRPAVGLWRRPVFWKWSAAAAVLCFTLIAIRHITTRQTGKHAYEPVAGGVQINPGGNKATLVLGNGAMVALKDSTADTVAMQGGSLVAQQKAGVLVYHKADAVTQGEIWNTVATPKGGKYEVVLSDGTHVFLNAASTVKFPVPFNKYNREVVLTGEAYFEVAHASGEKEEWPFLVKIRRAGDDGGVVKVLGTHFNIMAYDDEKVVKTTLVEGSVNMRKGVNAVTLKPGQQSLWFPQTNTLQVKPADLEAEIAWKKGRFLFRSTDIETIMRQLSRWYDVTVDYNGDMTDIRFAGNIERKENIRELIEILEADGRLRFQITGNKIIVSRI